MSESIPYHPLASIFPLLEGPAFDALVADISENGLQVPIVVTSDGAILDGRNRYRACVAAGIEPTFETYTGDDHLAYVISLNLQRRHLDESQRAMVAARIANLGKGRPRFNPQICGFIEEKHPAVTQKQASNMLNVGERTVQHAREVLDEGAPELVEAVERGEASVSAASQIASLPKDEQVEIVARGEAEILRAAKEIRERKSEERARENVGVASRKVEIPSGEKGLAEFDDAIEAIVAERAGFGNAETYRQAKKVVDEGAPELIEAMDRGIVSIFAASQIAFLTNAAQVEIAARLAAQ